MFLFYFNDVGSAGDAVLIESVKYEIVRDIADETAQVDTVGVVDFHGRIELILFCSPSQQIAGRCRIGFPAKLDPSGVVGRTVGRGDFRLCRGVTVC